MKFYNQYNNVKKASNPGQEIQEVYKRVYDKKLGTNIVQVVEVKNIYQEIQAAAEGSSLVETIDRYQKGYIDTLDTNIREFGTNPLADLVGVEKLNAIKEVDLVQKALVKLQAKNKRKAAAEAKAKAELEKQNVENGEIK